MERGGSRWGYIISISVPIVQWKQKAKVKFKKRMIMYKEYLKQKWEWVDSNPRTAAWLGGVKGILVGILLTLLLSGCGSTHKVVKECCSSSGVECTSVSDTGVN